MAPAPAGMQSSGHLALGGLLKSPDVDVLCSPVSYFDRAAGGGGFFMAPVDSVHLHGKLWLVEDDTRTHLSSPESGYGRANDVRETHGVLARNFGHIVTRGTAVWWMDLPGQGWFAGDEMWQFLSHLQRAYSKALNQQNAYRPEIAVVVDEHSPLYGAPDAQVLMPLLYKFRAVVSNRSPDRNLPPRRLRRRYNTAREVHYCPERVPFECFPNPRHP